MWMWTMPPPRLILPFVVQADIALQLEHHFALQHLRSIRGGDRERSPARGCREHLERAEGVGGWECVGGEKR